MFVLIGGVASEAGVMCLYEVVDVVLCFVCVLLVVVGGLLSSWCRLTCGVNLSFYTPSKFNIGPFSIVK